MMPPNDPETPLTIGIMAAPRALSSTLFVFSLAEDAVKPLRARRAGTSYALLGAGIARADAGE